MANFALFNQMTGSSNYYIGIPSDYNSDQALHYPLVYPTGYDNSHQIPSPNYSAEGVPYLCYVPGYGYMYSSPDQYNPYQYVPYQSQPSLAPSGYVQFFVQPGSQALPPPQEPIIYSSRVSGTGTNNTGTKSRSHTSTSATNSTVSPISLVTGASRSSHHNQITTNPPEQTSRDHPGENANSAIENSTASNSNLKSKSENNSSAFPQNAIKIFAELYKGVDFSVDYPNAKFFVIKSYSEDDVHKSIKYNVWSSTPNGNRRLNAAYLAAQEIAAADPKGCPVFLFFSVNASGQFIGVVEMVGPVDFGKHVDFWQQDKWQGSFPVKWHIVKDVLNASFRHITLENNEDKPVTNSRDTQEILYHAGMNMLRIFKNMPLTSSVLEDFKFYEGRQLSMLQDKCRRLGRVYDSSLFTPAVVLKTGSVADRPVESEASNEIEDLESIGNQPESEVESEEKRELESEEKRELESEEKLKLESEEKLELESEEKLELESEEKLELESEKKRELKSEKKLDLESKEILELESKDEGELELKEEVERSVGTADQE